MVVEPHTSKHPVVEVAYRLPGTGSSARPPGLAVRGPLKGDYSEIFQNPLLKDCSLNHDIKSLYDLRNITELRVLEVLGCGGLNNHQHYGHMPLI